MHPVNIPQKIVDRVVQRRGTAHVHSNLNPATTALLVIDLQNAFLVEEYAVSYVPEAVSIIPNVNRLAKAVRATGGKVFWVRNTTTDQTRKDWSHWFAMLGHNAERAAKREANMTEGSMGHQLHSKLTPAPEDQTVLKHRFSALIQGSSDLNERLIADGIDTVVITGTLTDVCCESTARDAMMLNYKTIMVSDGTAARTDEEHNASLAGFYSTFGDVMDTDFLIKTLHHNVRSGSSL